MICSGCGKKLADNSLVCPICNRSVEQNQINLSTQSRCSKCGRQLNDNISACPICSQPVNIINSSSNTEPYTSNQEVYEVSPQSHNANNKRTVIVICAIFIFACICIVVLLLFMNISQKTLTKDKAENIYLANANDEITVECLSISDVTGVDDEKKAEMKSTLHTMFGEKIHHYDVIYAWDKNISEWSIISKKDLGKDEFKWDAESLAGDWEYTAEKIHVTLKIENDHGMPRIASATMQEDYWHYSYAYSGDGDVFSGSTNGFVKVPLFSNSGAEWDITISGQGAPPEGIFFGERNYLNKLN